MLGLLATAIWAGAPLGLFAPSRSAGAAWAHGGSGSGGSGSGSGSGHDDDGEDDDHGGGGNSGSGGSSGSGSGSSGNGKPGKRSASVSIGKSRRPIFGGDGIHIQFFDGHIERIRAGQFERIDKAGRLVEKHGASSEEFNRLKSLEAAFMAKGRASGIVTVADIDERAGRVEIIDFRGWRETLMRARYELSDPNGRTVAHRALTPEDIVRVRTLLYLN